MRFHNLLAALLLAACVGEAREIELQSSDKIQGTADAEEVAGNLRQLGSNLRLLRTGQNGVGFYAQVTDERCYFAVQGFGDGRFQLDTYSYSDQPSLRCDQSVARKIVREALSVRS